MSFWIAAARVEMRLPFATSLKDRRHVVRSITDGVRSRFAVSAADLGPNGVYNAAVIGFAAAGSSATELEERMDNLERFLYQREETGEFTIDGFTPEVFKYDDISDREDK